jgi:hypothetical protein
MNMRTDKKKEERRETEDGGNRERNLNRKKTDRKTNRS